MQRREYMQISRTGKTRIWTIEVNGPLVHTTFGELGGQMQSVTDEGRVKNAGRSNEKSAEEDALYLAERAIKKKVRSGYRLSGEEAATEIDWDSHELPENLRFYKPSSTLSKSMLRDIELGKALFTWKRDGEMMVIVKWAQGEADIFSRTMLRHHHLEKGKHTWNDRFRPLLDEIAEDAGVPARTLLLGDVIADPRERQRWEVASFMKSLTESAQQLPPLFLYCWDIAFWDGEDLAREVPLRERYDIIHDTWGREWNGISWVVPVFTKAASSLMADTLMEYDTPVEAARAVADDLGWEGWVVVNPNKVMGDRAYNFRGKTDRPSTVSCKLKPVREGDFIAYFDPDRKVGKEGRGKYRGMVGSVALYQMTAQGTETYICDCGGGIDDIFRSHYSDPAVYPIVVEVEYTERTFVREGDKTNALTFPRIVRVREDKSPEECVESRL